MRISDWSSDVCSSDLGATPTGPHPAFAPDYRAARSRFRDAAERAGARLEAHRLPGHEGPDGAPLFMDAAWIGPEDADVVVLSLCGTHGAEGFNGSAAQVHRSEEHTSELQSLMRISYAGFCMTTKHQKHNRE